MNVKEEIRNIVAHFRVGDKCVCEHPYAFRSGESFTIVSICLTYLPSHNVLRYVYVVMYADGTIESIPVTDEKGCEMRYGANE